MKASEVRQKRSQKCVIADTRQSKYIRALSREFDWLSLLQCIAFKVTGFTFQSLVEQASSRSLRRKAI
jgi:hypothetical protein